MSNADNGQNYVTIDGNMDQNKVNQKAINKSIDSDRFKVNLMYDELPPGRQLSYFNARKGGPRYVDVNDGDGNIIKTSNYILTCPVTAGYEDQTGRKVFNSSIRYHFSSTNSCGKQGFLEINEDENYIGEQSAEDGRELVSRLLPKESKNLINTRDNGFDMRALMFTIAHIVGSFAMDGITPLLEFRYDRTQVTPISLTTNEFNSDAFIITPESYSGSREYWTLIALTQFCGIDRWYDVRYTIPNDANILAGWELVGYCFKLFALIMATTRDIGCASPHFIAFFRGLTTTMSLHAHTVDGGLIRDILKNAIYPPIRGLIKGTTDTWVLGVNTREILPPERYGKLAISFYLMGARCVSAADPGTTKESLKIPTIIEKTLKTDEETNAKPSYYQSFRSKTYEWSVAFQSTVAKMIGVTETLSNLEMPSMRKYFDDDKPERHLNGKYIVPFFWVEPTGIDIYDDIKEMYGSYIHSNNRGLIPYLDPEMTLIVPEQNFNDGGPETNYIPPPGDKTMIIFKSTKMRDHGIEIVHSTRFNPEDGLAQFKRKKWSEAGLNNSDMAFCNNSISLATRRWITLDNPFPNPAEQYITSINAGFELTYLGKPGILAPNKARETKVWIIRGKLRTFKGTDELKLSVDRKVPKSMVKEMNTVIYNNKTYAYGRKTKYNLANAIGLKTETINQFLSGPNANNENDQFDDDTFEGNNTIPKNDGEKFPKSEGVKAKGDMHTDDKMKKELKSTEINISNNDSNAPKMEMPIKRKSKNDSNNLFRKVEGRSTNTKTKKNTNVSLNLDNNNNNESPKMSKMQALRNKFTSKTKFKSESIKNDNSINKTNSNVDKAKRNSRIDDPNDVYKQDGQLENVDMDNPILNTSNTSRTSIYENAKGKSVDNINKQEEAIRQMKEASQNMIDDNSSFERTPSDETDDGDDNATVTFDNE